MATILDAGIPGVGSGVLMPKSRNLWRVTFANFGGGTDSQPVSMQAITITRPTLEFENIPVHRYNTVAKYGGKHSWGDIKLVIQDDVTGSATTVLQAQLQKQQWLIGAEGQWFARAGESSLYKFVTFLDMLDGNDRVIEKWTCEGCWIAGADWGELDYSTGEPVQISLTLSIDHARQDIGGYNQGPGILTGGTTLS